MCKADEGLFFVVSQSALYHSARMLNTLASHFALHFKALVPCSLLSPSLDHTFLLVKDCVWFRIVSALLSTVPDMWEILTE